MVKTVHDFISSGDKSIRSVSIDPDDGSIEITIVEYSHMILPSNPPKRANDRVIVQRWNADNGKLVLASEKTGVIEYIPSSSKIIMDEEQ